MEQYILRIERIDIIGIPTQEGVKTIDKILATLETPQGLYCIHQRVPRTEIKNLIDLIGKKVKIDPECISQEYDIVDGQVYLVLTPKFYNDIKKSYANK